MINRQKDNKIMLTSLFRGNIKFNVISVRNLEVLLTSVIIIIINRVLKNMRTYCSIPWVQKNLSFR